MAVPAPVLIFNREGYDIHLALLSPRDLRLALKTTPPGERSSARKPTPSPHCCATNESQLRSLSHFAAATAK